LGKAPIKSRIRIMRSIVPSMVQVLKVIAPGMDEKHASPIFVPNVSMFHLDGKTTRSPPVFGPSAQH
jgi:hypothetical protein